MSVSRVMTEVLPDLTEFEDALGQIFPRGGAGGGGGGGGGDGEAAAAPNGNGAAAAAAVTNGAAA